MQYITGDRSLSPYIRSLLAELNKPEFDINQLTIPTRMYKAMRLIGEVDRLSRLQRLLPEVQQYQVQDDINILNDTIRKLSVDVPVCEQFSEKAEITVTVMDSNHPYIRVYKKYLDNGFESDRAITLAAGTSGVNRSILKKFLIDHNALPEATIKANAPEAYTKGIIEAKIRPTLDNMYLQANKYIKDSDDYNSYINGFTSVAHFSEDEIKSERLKYLIVNYSENFSESIRNKIIETYQSR